MAGKKYNSFYVRLVSLLLLFFGVVIWVAFGLYKIIVVEGDFWRSHATAKNDTITVYPPRGNIYDCNRNLLVSSLPKYRVFVDFGADKLCKNEAQFKHDIDSLCIHASRILNIDRNRLRSRILDEMSKPKNKRNRRCEIFGSSELDHPTKNALFGSKFISDYNCFYTEKRIKREKPFATLSSRTLGGVYQDAETEGKGGNSGLELYYNEELKGKTGVSRKQRIRNRNYLVSITEPEEGCDLITTFDVKMMDIVESELKSVMIKDGTDHACAVVMDVKTGEIKAMSNLKMNSSGEFYDEENYVMTSLTEPGSTFKVASVVALLESGRVDTSYKIDTGEGIWQLPNWNKPMRDHNHQKGGYGEISLAKAIWYSSNIGISKPVTEVFGLSRDSSKKFVDRLYSMKLNEKLDLEIPGVVKPNIPHPTDKGVKWSGMSLPWMSIGYGVQVPPIYTLTFYNGLANNGKMIKPVFVRTIEKDGRIVRSVNTEVLNPKLCSNNTLLKVKEMLRGVITDGTGKLANSSILPLAGKSGTAQMYVKNVMVGYQLSFCGFFPADEPKYSCIVVMWQTHTSVSPSVAFGKIAERIYAMGEKEIVRPDDESRVKPYLAKVKHGKTRDVDYLLDKLDLRTAPGKVSSEWCLVENNDSTEVMKPLSNKMTVVPNVIGWGAKDAVFLLENRGLKVYVQGRGKVVQQSVSPGTTVAKGGVIKLVLKS